LDLVKNGNKEMCGIAGYIYKSGRSITDSTIINLMLKVQAHRGPDDSGIRAFDLRSGSTIEIEPGQDVCIPGSMQGVLGFNRLSILDLSLNGHQPMASPDGNVILIFNGEIYNAFDFKNELISAGFKFRSSTDSEVILYLYQQYGFDAMIRKLNGMFGLAILDLNAQKIFVARDRFGIKPVYIYNSGELFAFASEIKSLLAIPAVDPILDSTLLDEYLIFRNVLNNTLFKNISGLDPGSYITYAPGQEPKTEFYFDIESYQRDPSPENALALEEVLQDSVQRQLMSDVKLGCQLSGGIDSSVVSYLAKKIKRDDLLETISIIFDDKRFNEEPYIDQVTRSLGLVSHKFKMDSKYYLDNFENATWHFEAPLNHPNTMGIYLLSQRAKQHVTVLLSGEGADEVFGGYDRFINVNHPYNPRIFASALKKNRMNPARHLMSYSSKEYRAIMGSAYMVPGLAEGLKGDFNFTMALQSRRNIYKRTSGSIFDRQIKYEIKTYLPDLLIRQDKMSMAHSIENRVPFLDNELVKFSFGIPEADLLGKSQTKHQLKKIAASVFGDRFAYRSKGGFGIPVREFFSDKKFNQYLREEILPSMKNRGLFNTRKIETWVNCLDTITSAELDAVWMAVAFETWARKFNIA
jgi:asparagine synthase (glutamine-hydrolysing)